MENTKGGKPFINSKKVFEGWDSTNCDIVCNILSIPVGNESFDYIMCTEVFEHIAEPQMALKELTRILKPGGKMLITAPFRCTYYQEPLIYYSRFSTQWYEYFSVKFNLKIEEITPNGNYYADIAQEVIRMTLVGGLIQRFFCEATTLPYILYLFMADKISKSKTPKSCWGYHLIISKN